MAVTWSMVDKTSNMILSNGNLNAVLIRNSGVRATENKTKGKWYWEITVRSAWDYFYIGIINKNGTLVYDGITTNTCRVYGTSSGPTCKKFPGNIATGGSFVENSVISIVLNMDKGTLAFYRDGIYQGIFFTDIQDLSPVCAYVSRGNTSNSSTITANFGATGFKYKNIFDNLIGYKSYDSSQVSLGLFMIKQNSQYFTITKDFYDIQSDRFLPVPELGNNEYGFDISDIHDDLVIYDENIDITPIMTNASTPIPYNVTSNSEYNTKYSAWHVFNNNADQIWLTKDGRITGWVSIDLGEVVKINNFSLTSSYPADMVKNFTLHGSNDGIIFEHIQTFNNNTRWVDNETRNFKLIETVNYRHYKLEILTNNGRSNYSGIKKIKYYYNDIFIVRDPISYFTHSPFTLVTDSVNKLELIAKGLKIQKELITSSGDIKTSIASNIDYFNLKAILNNNNTNLKITFSIDRGRSWYSVDKDDPSKIVDLGIEIPLKPYSNMDSRDRTLYQISRDVIYESGSTVDEINSFNYNLLDSKTIRFAYVLYRENYYTDAEVDQLSWKFDAKGYMKEMKDNEFNTDIYDNRVRIKSLIENELIRLSILI